jgi:hypothetical protein
LCPTIETVLNATEMLDSLDVGILSFVTDRLKVAMNLRLVSTQFNDVVASIRWNDVDFASKCASAFNKMFPKAIGANFYGTNTIQRSQNIQFHNTSYSSRSRPVELPTGVHIFDIGSVLGTLHIALEELRLPSLKRLILNCASGIDIRTGNFSKLYPNVVELSLR